MGSEIPASDPNPILDEGVPISVGGIYAATLLSNILGIPFVMSSCTRHYTHSWGPPPSLAQPVLGSWSFTTFDVNGLPTTFEFDIIDGPAPIIIGLDARKFSDTYNLTTKPFVIISRPCDSKPRKFYTHVTKDENGNERIHVDIVLHRSSTTRSIVSSNNLLTHASPLSIAKRIHRYSHARYEDMKDLLKRANCLTPPLDHCLRSVASACEICSGHGRPSITRKISLSRINSQFNEKIQLDFFWTNVRKKKLVCLHFVDTFSTYSEIIIAPTRSQDFIATSIENEWIFRYGAPSKLSGDQEFDKSAIHALCAKHHITICPRPTRRHNKSGIVERKNAIIKNIIARISAERCSSKIESIIARSCFLSNLFSGSKLLSSFQLARGYSPSILGIPTSTIPQDLLEAYKSQTATRALHKLLHTRAPNTVPTNMLPANRLIWVYHKSTKHNEPNQWEKARVISCHPHFLIAKGIKATHGPPMKVAYEDIRLVPQGQLTEELATYTLEEVLQHETDTTPTQ